MKTLTNLWKVALTCAIVLLSSTVTEASHYRYGNISWERVAGGSGYRVQFKMAIAWRKNFQSQWNLAQVGSVVNGGLAFRTHAPTSGNSIVPQLTVTSINTTENWFYGEFTWTYDYGGPGIFTPGWTSCCRIGSLSNNANGSFTAFARIGMSAPYGTAGNNNASPVTSITPIVKLSAGLNAAQFQIPAIDPDGDVVSFRLANPNEAGSGTANPLGTSIDPSTGVVTFSTMGKPVGSLHNIIAVVEDGRGAASTIDFLVQIVQPSTPPAFVSPTPPNGQNYQLQPGQSLNFTVSAADGDPGDVVTINAVGLPPSSAMSPTLPVSGTNSTSSSFSWTPGTTDLGTSVINFSASDANGVTVNTSVSITVSLKPQFASSVPSSGSIFCLGTNDSFIQNVTASDPDAQDAVVISYSGSANMSFNSPMPTGSGNPISVEATYNTTASDWGVQTASFTATDTYGDTRTINWSFIVNDPPVVTSTPVDMVPFGQPYTYVVTTSDNNAGQGDEVGLEHATVPSWMTAVDNNDGTITLSGTPSLADVGIHNVELEIEDEMNHQLGTHCGLVVHSFTVEVLPCNISLVGTANDVSCNGGSDGSIDLTVTGAYGATSYAWSNGATTEDLSGLSAGTYSVTVTDANGCDESMSFVINEPLAITHNFSFTPILCAGGLSVQSITIYGGTPPYTVTNQGGGALVIGLGEGVTAGGNTYAANYTYTITDANGCTEVFNVNIPEPTPVLGSLSVTPAIGVNPGGQPNTIYIGYGPSSLTLSASANGGTPPYTYSWSNSGSLSSATGASVSASPTTTTSYTVTMTDANGCTTSESVTINVVDVTCGKKGNKVLVCKVPPGNPGNAHTICVSPNAVASHLATGSYLGPCSNKMEWSPEEMFTVFPNPSSGRVTLSLDLVEDMRVQYEVVNINGSVLHSGVVDEMAGHYQVQLDLSNQANGMYFVRFTTDESTLTKRLSVNR